MVLFSDIFLPACNLMQYSGREYGKKISEINHGLRI